MRGGSRRWSNRSSWPWKRPVCPLINDPKAPRSVADKTRMEQQAKEKSRPPRTHTHELAKVLIEPETPMSSRDPIRMYLSQMGNIPLLSREDEIFLAKQIEITRKRFRRTMMESDFALDIAVDILEKVQAGELPFERTLRTSDTENTAEGTDSRPHAAQPADAAAPAGREPRRLRRSLHDDGIRSRDKQTAKRADGLRRRKLCHAVRRTQRPHAPPAAGLSSGCSRSRERMTELERDMPRLQAPQRQPPQRSGARCSANWTNCVDMTLETPNEFRARMRETRRPLRRLDRTPSSSSPAATCGWSSRSPRSTATAGCQLPRPDSGRERRPDARRREVRIPPRLQVLDLRDVVDSAGDHPGCRRSRPHDPHSGPHVPEHLDAQGQERADSPGDRPRAEHGRTGRSGRPVGRRDRTDHEDLEAPDQPRHARRRERRLQLRRLPRRRQRRHARPIPRCTRCSGTRSTTSSRA